MLDLRDAGLFVTQSVGVDGLPCPICEKPILHYMTLFKDAHSQLYRDPQLICDVTSPAQALGWILGCGCLISCSQWIMQISPSGIGAYSTCWVTKAERDARLAPSKEEVP